MRLVTSALMDHGFGIASALDWLSSRTAWLDSGSRQAPWLVGVFKLSKTFALGLASGVANETLDLSMFTTVIKRQKLWQV